jgi:hypothetical protein
MLHGISNALLNPGGPWLFVKLVALAFAVSAILRLVPVRRSVYYGRRAVFKVASAAAALTIVACAGAAYAFAHGQRGAILPPSHHAGSSPESGHYLGVFEPGELTSYDSVIRFGQAAHAQPQIVLYYSAWPGPFNQRFATEVSAHGATPYLDWEPYGVTMAAVAAGQYDSYLRSFATSVRSYNHRLIISFAPEANGDWYPWGWTHTSPRTWVRAWRHVVTLFRRMGASNVTWLWNMNRHGGGMGPVTAYWPGAAYVDWAGIDGYYYSRGQTFSAILAPTVTAIRRLTAKPILLSETAIGQVAGQARTLPDIFAGIRRYNLAGLVWFDMAQHGGFYHQDWRLEGHPKAIAAFRRGVASMLAAPYKP